MPPKSIAQWNKRPPTGLTTGQQLKRKNPERYNSLCRALSLGVPHETATKVFQTSRELINAVCTAEKIDPASDQLIINKLAHAQNLCADALITSLEDGTLRGERAAVPLGILTDKLDQLMRRPTKIVETRNINLTQAALEDLINQAKPIEAEVVEDKT
jgi:hypothetical protein